MRLGPAWLVTLDGSSLEPARRAQPSPRPVPSAAARSRRFAVSWNPELSFPGRSDLCLVAPVSVSPLCSWGCRAFTFITDLAK